MTQHKKAAFLAAFAKEGTILRAAEAAQISRRTHYLWLSQDEAYAIAFREVEHDAGEALEAEARKRAFAGSDTLLIFLLKAAIPSKYRERVDMTLDVRQAVERLTADPAERMAAMAEVERILAGSRS